MENEVKKDKYESYVVVHNIAKRHNVGTLARSATAFGVTELILVGRRDFNAFGSHGSTSHLRFRHFHSLSLAHSYLKERDCDICGVEITESAMAVNKHPFMKSTAFLLGNEPLSIGGPSRGTFLEEVAAHVRRATDDLPRAWNAELEEVAGRRSLETAQAALTHALQTSVLMAKVVNDLEGGPDVARLQMQLERAVKSLGESQQRLAAAEEQNKKLELDCQQAASAIEQLKAYLERAMTNVEEGRRLVVARNLEIAGLQERIETKTGEAADSAAELARRTEELSIKTAALASAAADLEAARNEIAALKTQLKEADRSPSPDAALVGEFSYYMAFADSLRVSSKAGVEVGPLVELLRGYATENPMHPDYPLPILDLQTVHGIDLSWYPRPEQLVLPPADEPATADGDAAEGSKAAGGDDAAA
ncbi:hypothetical protein OROGR_025350 [Orobanche gracilis]